MNDNELMRGNLVYADGEVCRIQSIGHGEWVGVWNFSKEDTENLLLHELSPIPITEELLKKNGFDEPFYRTDTKCSTHVRSLENGCELWARFHVPRKYWYLDVVNEDGFILSSGKVDYLHQLQNLCNIAGVDMEWKV